MNKGDEWLNVAHPKKTENGIAIISFVKNNVIKINIVLQHNICERIILNFFSAPRPALIMLFGSSK